MTLCAFVEWPEGLLPNDAAWEAIRRDIAAVRPALLITNELPFGTWRPNAPALDRAAADSWIEQHAAGLDALAQLEVPAVISSRPAWSRSRSGHARLVNEAVAVENGKIGPLHRKQFFPDETGWHEASWFTADDSGFALHEVAGLKVGILLCTELMFNEYARRYGRAGADLIAVPRATGRDYQSWETAGAMAAIVSGSYVISANRLGQSGNGPDFGGRGFACAPDGQVIAETSPALPLATIELDLSFSHRQKSEYPCYVVDSQEKRAT